MYPLPKKTLVLGFRFSGDVFQYCHQRFWSANRGSRLAVFRFLLLQPSTWVLRSDCGWIVTWLDLSSTISRLHTEDLAALGSA